jgi:hypothetical protein
VGKKGEEVLTPDAEHRGVHDCLRRGGEGLILKKRHLAEHFARSEERDNEVASGRGIFEDFDLAMRHNVKRLRGVAFAEDELIGSVVLFAGKGG